MSYFTLPSYIMIMQVLFILFVLLQPSGTSPTTNISLFPTQNINVVENLYGSLTVGLSRNLKYVDFKKSPSFSVSLNLKIGSKRENNLKYELLINLTK